MQFMTGKSVENLPRYMEQDRRDSEYQAKKEQRKTELEHAERIREVGKLLLSWDDYTPTGLMEFSKKYNVAQTELQEAAPMIKDFRTKYDKTVTNQSPDGIKRTSAWSSENPTAPRVDLGVSEVPKLDQLVGTNSAGAPTVSGWNPYNASKQGSEIVNGQTDDQRLQNDLKREMAMNPIKAEGARLKSEATAPSDISVAAAQGQNAAALTSGNETKVQKDIIDTSEGLARIGNIISQFKPEFQEIPNRLGIAWSALKSKLGVNISPADKKDLAEFSVYKQDSLSNINLYIKQITGAQMSEKEANRIRQALPDPGEGIFGGDSPEAFIAKSKNLYKQFQAANARYYFYLNQGLSEDQIKTMINKNMVVSLQELPDIINKRAEEIEKEIQRKNGDIPAGDVIATVEQQLAIEFGISK